MAAVIEVRGLRKSYRRLRGGATTALDGLDLEVRGGGVFGFLGPNGSGKTTTIRCLLGLVRPSGGECRLLGAPPDDLAAVIGRTGAIVETPTFFPNFSGRRNLDLLAGIRGVPKGRVGEVLSRVGLSDRAGQRVRAYSLGMKQRLGIAAALLKDPELLILDEPANGLDPAGIREVRELIRALGTEGRTVFLSSHLLGEIEQVCDRVAILALGRCITTGTVDEVLRAGRAAGLVARLPQDVVPAGLEALAAAGIEASSGGEPGVLRVRLDPSEGARVTSALADRGLYVSELRPDEASLEDVFLQLTGGAPPARPDVPPAPGAPT
ncbi:MAG TPA: ABC transporter ATP-binding protein [Actinomycetota bacterium]